MNKSDQQLKKYDVVARMFELINNLSEDQQIILLKQLVKESVVAQLGKLIVDMPKYQQLILLKQIEDMTVEGKRGHSRKPCLISVDYVVEDRAFTNYIQDISSGGVFIETSESFSIGQEITMAFSFSSDHRPSKFTGEIVRIKPNGIGVKFKDLTKYQEEIIKSTAEKMKGI
jgi:Tfp pilus assembly protein PilZ